MPSCKELRTIAKELSIRGYSKMNKAQLTSAIEGGDAPDLPVAESTSVDEPAGHLKLKVPKEERSARKSTSKWVAFCKEYSKENGVTYKEAMSKKDEYNLWKTAKLETVSELSEPSEPSEPDDY